MKGQTSIRAIGFISVLIWSLGSSGPALAQQAATESVNKGDQLEEITVTAQKRESTVETTPISITALTGADLQDRGITDISGVVQSVPGVSMRTSGPGQTELEIRGLTSSGGNSSTVGFYLDDTPLSAPASAQNGKVVIDPNLYDLNRIEVLRGPQGTLYGAGSMGGTIKLVPNAPNPNEFETSGQFIIGGTHGGDRVNNAENGMVNLPLIDGTMAVRLVASISRTSGWIDRIVIAQPDFPAPNPVTGTRGNVAAAPIQSDYKDVNDENARTVRASVLWTPMDRLSIEPSFMYQEITQGGLNLIDSNPGTLTNYQPFNAPEPFEDRIDIASLNVKYHFDFADLSSTTSYWLRDENLRQDGAEEIATVTYNPANPADFPYFPIYANGPFGPGIGANSPTSLEDDKSKQVSEEVRLTSSGDTAFKWLVGYFYQDFESDWDLFVDTPQAVPVVRTPGDAFTQYQPTKILQNSFFGEASYTFFNQLTATAGLRRYYYTREREHRGVGLAELLHQRLVRLLLDGRARFGRDTQVQSLLSDGPGFAPLRDCLSRVSAGRRQSTHSDDRTPRQRPGRLFGQSASDRVECRASGLQAGQDLELRARREVPRQRRPYHHQLRRLFRELAAHPAKHSAALRLPVHQQRRGRAHLRHGTRGQRRRGIRAHRLGEHQLVARGVPGEYGGEHHHRRSRAERPGDHLVRVACLSASDHRRRRIPGSDRQQLRRFPHRYDRAGQLPAGL